MNPTCISSSSLEFLTDLEANNNREWFAKNKERYLLAKDDVTAFAQTLLSQMEEHDEIEKLKVFRIYRDVRFSKNKIPYKNHLSGFMVRATKWRRGGMYFHFEPNGNSKVGGGFWSPSSPDLSRIRQEIAADDTYFRKILADKKFKKHFGNLYGNQLKTAPKGYPKDHKSIDLLRYKQFLLAENFTDEEVVKKGFVKKMVKSFVVMRPFFDLMSDILTTDSNGVPIED